MRQQKCFVFHLHYMIQEAVAAFPDEVRYSEPGVEGVRAEGDATHTHVVISLGLLHE